jgi:hypothetical protein
MIKLEDYSFNISSFFKKTDSIRSQLFFIKTPLKEILSDSDNISVKSTLLDKEDLKILLISIKNIDDKPKQFIILELPRKLFILLGKGKRRMWNRAQGEFFRNFPRDIGYSFLTSEEIKQILFKCQDEIGSSLFYRRFVARGVFGKKIDFTDVYYERLKGKKFIEAFLKATNKRGWVQMIEVYDEHNSLGFIINRKGEITILNGGLNFLLKHLINQEIDLFLEKNKFYSNRDRLNTENKPKPIRIIFDTNVFEDKIMISKFMNKIEKYPKCNFSVVEKGNPFLYVNILDRNDMSSFSVRTFEDNTLILFPKIKTSSFSLQRFSKYLVENFMEGKIHEYKK